MAIDNPVCANCGGNGGLVCAGCRLALYCSVDCQKSHRPEHKQYCRSPLIKSDWEPDWVKEDRQPAFIGDGPPTAEFGGVKYFWGTVPALDVIQLSANEGEAFDSEMNLLFAASGDLSNVIKSLASLPTAYHGAVTSVINDADFDIVARNTIMLLVALSSDDDTQATRVLIHLWYSAFIQNNDAEYLKQSVRPMIQDVVEKIASKEPSAICGKTWTFKNCTLRLELPKARWSMLLDYFDVPHDVTLQMAQEARREVVLAPSRKDFQDRSLLCQSPYHRVVDQRFREDGILAPFGQSRAAFTVPNPTFFRNAVWPMSDAADPVAGWSLTEIRNINAYGAGNDLYGKLYFHLQKLLGSFRTRLTQHSCHFRMLNVNAVELPSQLADVSFARIETSNISDAGFLGIRLTIETLAPLLQPPEINPHATLITLFLNANLQVETALAGPRTKEAELTKAGDYIGHYYKDTFTKPPDSEFCPMVIKWMMAQELVRDMDQFFDKYMEWREFKPIEQTLGVEMKKRHTIIEKWPLRLKLRMKQSGAKEEFESLLSSAHTGNERYVEWRRKV